MHQICVMYAGLEVFLDLKLFSVQPRLQYESRAYYVKTPWNGNVALVIVLIINIACSRCAFLMWEVHA